MTEITGRLNIAAIPQEIKVLPRWVTWKTEIRNGRPTKTPYTPGTARHAKSNDLTTWRTFDQALADFQTQECDGIGFQLGDGYTGIDLDHCATDRQVKQWAMDIVRTVNSYTEYSPSGKGLHIIVKGELPSGRRRKNNVEMYDSGRYFTVTGHVLSGYTKIENRQVELDTLYARLFPRQQVTQPERPREVCPGGLDDDEVLRKAALAQNGAKFSRLWAGDWSGYSSQSEADLALCAILNFWTGGDASQIDRLFRRSGLMRDKWDEKRSSTGATYGAMTISRALEGTEYYTPGNDQNRSEQDLASRSKTSTPFDISLLSRRAQHLLKNGFEPGRRHSKQFQSAAAAGLSVAKEMLAVGASGTQVLRALISSPLTNGQESLAQWIVERAREQPLEGTSVQALRNELLRILTDADREPGQPATPIVIRIRNEGRVLLDYLTLNGYLVHDPLTLTAFYMDVRDRTLMRLDSPQWEAWLHRLTTINPALPAFKALHSEVVTAAQLDGLRCIVVQVAHWDKETQVLRVSRFDGTVYKLDGATIETEPNGAAGVLFEDDPSWQPYAPDFEPVFAGQPAKGKALDWTLADVPNWENNPEEHTLTLRAWLLATFFPELQPTKAMLVFLGEKGSGKSLTLRILLRMMFGPAGEVGGVPDRPDGFTAAAAASHILVIDNLDSFRGWLRDKIARATTGAIDYHRKLYTSNQKGIVRYRCFLACTSRTPDTLQRDDLADRLLILPVTRVKNPEPESLLLRNTETLRNAWWGDVLMVLNQVVALIRQDGLPTTARLRMADFAALAQVIAKVYGQSDVWEWTVRRLQEAQAGLLLEEDPVVDALTAWLQDETNHGRGMLSRQLYDALTEALYGEDGRPERNWPKTVKGFARNLSTIRRDLQTRFEIQWEQGTTRETANRLVYRFWPK